MIQFHIFLWAIADTSHIKFDLIQKLAINTLTIFKNKLF